MTYDVAIIGGGCVGLATAYHLSIQHPDRRLVVLEKEAILAAHQTGHNSGVIHSGVFYRPGSMRAVNCREGRRRLLAFCEREGIAYELCGKVIVAVEESERPHLDELERRGRANGVACERIGPARLREVEPHVRGIDALHVLDAGVTDYVAVARRLAERVRERGHDIRTRAGVRAIEWTDGLAHLETAAGSIEARYVINCAGLYSDRVARMSGQTPEVQIVPFRGEYYELTPGARNLCHALIYPVPDPSLPFLGVHFTRTHDGRVLCGPSAVLAFAREGYTLSDVNWGELAEILTYPGMMRLAVRHWRSGLEELLRSLSRRAYLRALQRLIPAVADDDLLPAVHGVRAQAVTREGRLLDDFLIHDANGMINVLNAASPAATAALNIGRVIGDRLTPHLT